MATIGKKEIFSVALGSVIGWGAFVLPGNTFLPSYGLSNTVIGFVIAVFMLLFIEHCYMNVSQKVPKAGGEYSFAKVLLGEKQGFVTGWGLLLSYISIIPLNATALPMVLDAVFPFYDKGKLLYDVVGYPVYLNDIIISELVIMLFVFIHLRDKKSSLSAQNICVFALVFALIAISLFSIPNVGEAEIENWQSNLGEIDSYSIIRVIAFAPWAFIGFDAVAQLSEEHKMSAKKVSLITILAIVIGAVIYNALNAITALGVHADNIASVSWATGESVKNLVGNQLFYLLAIAMFGAVLSGLNGFFMSASRLILSMSEQPSETNRTTNATKGELHIPAWVVYFIGLFSIIVPFFGRTALLWFVDLSSIGASVAYFMTCLCAYKIVTQARDKMISLLGMAVSLLFLVFLLTPFFKSNISEPSYYALLFWVALGGFVYVKFVRKRISMA